MNEDSLVRPRLGGVIDSPSISLYKGLLSPHVDYLTAA
jgi:hypothetical protein